jgi:hypothetical protein
MAHAKYGRRRANRQQRQGASHVSFISLKRLDVSKRSLMLGSALMGGIFMVLAGTSGAAAQCVVVNNGASSASRAVTCVGVDGDGVSATTSSFNFGLSGGNITVGFTTPAAVVAVGDAMTLKATAGSLSGGSLTFNMGVGNTVTSTTANGVLATVRNGGTINIGGTIIGGANAFSLTTTVGAVGVDLAAGSILSANGGVGLLINRTGLGDTKVTANGLITATDDGIRVNHKGAGSITIANGGSIGAFGNAVGGNGIDAQVLGVGSITATNTGNIYSKQAGITALTTVGNTIVNNSGLIQTFGTDAAGIQAYSAGAIQINGAGGEIKTAADGGPGMTAIALGNVTISTTGDINSGNGSANLGPVALLGALVPDLNTLLGVDLSGGVVVISGGAIVVGDQTKGLPGSTITTAGNFGVFGGALGNVSVFSQDGTIDAVNGTGIAGLSIGGNVTIVSGDVTSGAGGLDLSFVAPGLTVGGGVVGVALAGSVDITTQGSTKTSGLFGVLGASLAKTANVTTNGVVDGGSLAGVAGIAAGDVTIKTNALVGGGLAGVFGGSFGGNVSITTVDPVTANGIGVIAASNAGAITIKTGDVTGGVGGILAGSVSGAITLTGGSTIDGGAGIGITTISGGAAPIDILGTWDVVGDAGGILAAQLGTGAVNILNTGEVTSANGVGIAAGTAGGNITIAPAGNVSGGLGGIAAVVVGAGEVDIKTAVGSKVTASTGVGILGAAGGNVNITTNGAVSGNLIGISATSIDGTVAVTTFDKVTSNGIGIQTLSGVLGTTINANADVTAGGIGIAAGTGSGPLSITAGNVTGGLGGIIAVTGFGQVDIKGTGADNGASALVDGGAGVGIGVLTTGPAGSASVNVTGDWEVRGGVNGISAIHVGSGDVNIVGAGAVSGGVGVGILATSVGGDIAINRVGSVSGDLNGIFAATTSTGGVKIDTVGVVKSANGLGVLTLAIDGETRISTGAVSGALAGVSAASIGGNIFIDSSATGVISGGAGIGILAASITGDIDIKPGSDVSGALAGISANTIGGNVVIATALGSTVTSTGGVGVSALAGGNIGIDTLGSTINANGPGILAIGGGTVLVDAGAINVNAGGLGFLSGGALAIGGGDTTVNVQGKISVTGGTFGALAVSTGGNATVNVNALIDPPVIGSAAVTFGAGTATNNVNAVIEATTVGAAAANFGSGNVVLDVKSSAEIRTNGIGLLAVNIGSGDITVTNRADIGGLVNPTATNGIVVFNAFGDGNVMVDSRGRIDASNDGVNVTKLAGDGATTVNVRGRIVAGDDGIEVNRVGGAGSVNVDFRGNLSAQDNGITVFRSIGDGDINVDVNSRSRITAANGDGVQVLGIATQGNVTVDVERARITASKGSAIDVITGSLTGDNNVTIYNDGRLVGAGTVLNPTIRVVADGNVTIDNDASIRTITNDPAGVAVAVLAGGEVNLVNTSFIRGTVLLGSLDLVPPATAASTTFNNSGYWRTEGFSGFGAVNSATVNNSGLIRTSGDTFFGFLSANPNSNHYNNTGVTEVNGTLTIGMIAPNDANFVNNSGSFLVNGTLNALGGSGLAFNNTGIVDMRDGLTNDRTNVSGTFTGTGASQMAIDASLGGPGSQADRLFAGQATAGVTSLVVQDINPGPGGFNPQGIVFAYTPTGNSALGDFVLDPASTHFDGARSVLDKGLFFYDIATRPGINNPGAVAQVLIGVPDSEVFQLPRAVSGAQTVWNETAGVWLDRQADLRRLLMPAPSAPVVSKDGPPTNSQLAALGSGAITPSLWAKTIGSWTGRDGSSTVSVLNRTYTFNMDYKQNVFGMIAGVDFGTRGMGNQNDALVFGALAGYLTSDLDFRNSANSFEYKGATVGLYGTYINGGFYADLLFKADMLDMKWKAPTLNGFVNTAGQSPDANTYGARFDMGYRYAFAPSWFLEPTATLSYSKTDIDTIAVPGGSIGFEGQSLRGALGMRVGTGFQASSSMLVEASLTGRVWNEFNGDNRATIVNVGPTIYAYDKFDGAFGEVVGLVNVFNAESGWSGFANVGVKFNGDFTSTTAKAGVRYVWGKAPPVIAAREVLSVSY